VKAKERGDGASTPEGKKEKKSVGMRGIRGFGGV
jgi:hypothetical protein